ncbi:MAG: phenylalanine--tRNA ligase subunit beta [Cyclobacteriaceae bacterium]|nr:phenylalanine--tRNA ligase subunit beta [Cyclobacteriaceae bacterium]
MKISHNWLKQYIDIDDNTEKIGSILTDTGLEVEGITTISSSDVNFDGLVIGQVTYCERHPNADKLSITKVDVGGEEELPIVCGAPNVAMGQKVIVALVGTTLTPFGGDPFKIKKAKIRGEVSEGMICAEDEIGIGEDHAGIMVLDTPLKNGTPAKEFFKVSEDAIYEIGLTPNRGDATSHIGVARDLKAVLGKEVQWPSVDGFKVDNTDLPILVEVKSPAACPRYSGVTLTGLKVAPSPEWLQQRLRSIGLSPINNIVDVTNYVLHETGQPLHAFDADEISGRKVIVQTMGAGTTFTTLDEEERKLSSSDLMICNDKEGMCIAGVFGGIKSGVKNSTTSIFLESAHFSADTIRQTSMHHQLKTDASFRFERGTDPELTVYALKRAALLIKEVAGGQISSEIVDVYPEKITPVAIDVTYKNIHRLIGKALPHDLIRKILQDLDIELMAISDEGFTAIVPPYRSDVTREADIIEEVLRIYGFNNVEIPEKVGADYHAEFSDNDPFHGRKMVTDILNGNGYYEITTNSLTNPEYLSVDERLQESDNVVILNKLSEQLGVMRQSLMFTGLEVLAYNINRRQKNMKIFEFGKVYKKNGKGEGADRYTEENRLALFISGNYSPEHWRLEERKADFYDLSKSVRMIIERLGRFDFSSEPSTSTLFSYGLNLLKGSKVVGEFGKLSAKVLKKFQIEQPVFYAELNWDLILKERLNNIAYKEVSKFPEVRRDLSLVINKTITYDEIKAIGEKNAGYLLKGMNVFDVYEGDKIDTGKKAYAISFILQDEEKTLTDKIIDKTMNKLIYSYEKEVGAIIRK